MSRHPIEATRLRSLRFTRTGIIVDVDATRYDELAWHFASHLNALRIPYAIVSGYPTILMGRSRTSEDIDILAEPLPEKKFVQLHGRLTKKLECVSAGDASTLFANYLQAGDESTSVRYAWPGDPVPNVEFKFARNSLQHYSVKERIPVRANENLIQIGPLGVQIGYKLYLGTPKDFEDARWLYRVASGHFDEEEIWETAKKLGVDAQEARRVLDVD